MLTSRFAKPFASTSTNLVVAVYLVAAVWFTVGAAEEKTLHRSVRAYIVQEANRLVPSTSIDLGVVLPSEEVDVKVSLLNATTQEVTFNRTERACNCTAIEPSVGRILPGGTLDLRATFTAPDTPTAVRGGGEVSFYMDEELVLTATLGYAFDFHVGFPVRLLTVILAPSDAEEVIAVPMVIGDKVQDGSYYIEIEDLDVDFEYTVDREKSVMNGTLGLKEHRDFDRLFGRLQITNLKSGQYQSVPLILERESAISLHPRSLRFLQLQPESPFVANLYVRSSKELSDSALCRPSASLGDVIFNCVAKHIGNSVYKVELSATPEQVDAILAVNREVDAKRVKLSVEVGDAVARRSVPFHFQEFRE